MTVTQKLKEFAESRASAIAKDDLAVMGGFQKTLEESNPIKDMKNVGDTFPSFNLVDYKGDSVELKDFLGKKTIITFYRGGWCPYCSIELQGYKEISSEIKAKGANLIAISPEAPDTSSKLIEKLGLDYYVLSDVGNVLGKELGIVFKLTDDILAVYNKFGIDIQASQGSANNNELPAPATYVIDENAKIIFCNAFIDYKLRTEPSEVLKYL